MPNQEIPVVSRIRQVNNVGIIEIRHGVPQFVRYVQWSWPLPADPSPSQ
jgi:hypothetical protein